MRDATEQLIMVLDLSANNKVKAVVADRVLKCKCLGQHPDGSQCDEPVKARGLCAKCHYRWRTTRMTMQPSQAAIYDSKLIRAGRLLRANGAKQYRNKSVYRRLA